MKNGFIKPKKLLLLTFSINCKNVAQERNLCINVLSLRYLQTVIISKMQKVESRITQILQSISLVCSVNVSLQALRSLQSIFSRPGGLLAAIVD